LEIHAGTCEGHIGARALATKVLQQGFYWPAVINDAAKLGTKQCYQKKSNTKAYEQQWRPHPAQSKLKIKTIEMDRLKALANLQKYQYETRA
jgi:hypothetical protein